MNKITVKMNKTTSFNPNLDMDMLNNEDNKQSFNQLSYLSVRADIKDKNYGKTKKLQQGTNVNRRTKPKPR